MVGARGVDQRLDLIGLQVVAGTAMPVPPGAVTSSAVSSIVSVRSYSERAVARAAAGAVDGGPASPRADGDAAAGAAGRAGYDARSCLPGPGASWLHRDGSMHKERYGFVDRSL